MVRTTTTNCQIRILTFSSLNKAGARSQEPQRRGWRCWGGGAEEPAAAAVGAAASAAAPANEVRAGATTTEATGHEETRGGPWGGVEQWLSGT